VRESGFPTTTVVDPLPSVRARLDHKGALMEPPKIHIYTPARIVTLALVALAVLALGYVRFAPDDHVAVPSGAHAGDLALEPCEYSTESGSYAADCGTLVVRESRADPESPLIALPVTRIRATSDDPKEPIFRLEGGPGLTNMDFANASRFVDDHDVVLVVYRASTARSPPRVLRAFGFAGLDGFRSRISAASCGAGPHDFRATS
jgi:hypothetical protein